MQIAIVGAGLAGLACATSLAGAGHAVTLFDKGRGAGGRMSSRRASTDAGDASFDHGAQYFTARDPGFEAQLLRWSAAGLAAPWPAAGEEAWVGTPTMNAPVRQLAAGLDVRWTQRIEQLVPRSGQWHLAGEGIEVGPFEASVVALPAEQAAILLRGIDPTLAMRAADTPSRPCWTVMAAYAEPLPIATDLLQHQGALHWAARNSAKPGRSGPESWVLQATPEWSSEHLEEEPGAVLDAMLILFGTAARVPLPAPVFAAGHRWRYARSGSAGDGMLWSPERRLGVCGDWLIGPRVEAAWLSGTRLADAIIGGTR